MKHVIFNAPGSPVWKFRQSSEAYWWGKGRSWELIPLLGLNPHGSTLADGYFTVVRQENVYAIRQGRDFSQSCLLMASISQKAEISAKTTGIVLISGQVDDATGVTIILEPGQRLVLENENCRWFFWWNGKTIRRRTNRLEQKLDK